MLGQSAVGTLAYFTLMLSPDYLYHPEETSKNSDICDFSKVSDIGKVLYSMEN